MTSIVVPDLMTQTVLLTSSHIAALQYCSDRMTLFICYRNQQVRQIDDVSPGMFRRLVDGVSVKPSRQY